jgi:hypothetical protein
MSLPGSVAEIAAQERCEMAIYHVLGDLVLTSSEFRMKAAEVGERAEIVEANIADFTQIGINRPLTVQIRHVYTGQFPKQRFLSGNKDMLVTSATKDVAVFNAASRAVNFLRKDVAANSGFDSPAATDQGTPLVWYTPAVTSSSTILTLEIIFDEFPNELVGKISTALSGLAGIPIFIPAAGYLLAAGTVVKLAGDLGQALFDGKPVFSATETIDFDTPGAIIAEAEFRIICNPDFDASQFRFIPKRGLVDSNGKVYDGAEPYVVISLDGKKRDEFASFGATMASSALMQKFYNIKDGTEAALDTVVEAMKLFNDSKFRAKVDAIDKKLAGIDLNSPEGKDLGEKRNAFAANILNDVMKPK